MSTPNRYRNILVNNILGRVLIKYNHYDTQQLIVMCQKVINYNKGRPVSPALETIVNDSIDRKLERAIADGEITE